MHLEDALKILVRNNNERASYQIEDRSRELARKGQSVGLTVDCKIIFLL